MSLLEDPEIKKKYDKCKYIVKKWEHKFTKTHRRVPSKLDIREADVEVRRAYRKYFQLKTAALEESFMDVEGLDDEDFTESFSQEQHESTIEAESLSQLQLSNDDFTEPVAEESIQTDSFEDLHTDNQASDGIWGAHLNKQKSPSSSKVAEKEKGPSAPVQSITKKLFCGSKFTKAKRNPRKSLSFMHKKNTEPSFESPSFLSQPEPSLESFKSEEAIEILQSDSIFAKTLNSLESVKQAFSQPIPVSIIDSVLEHRDKQQSKKVDTGWLKRVTETTGVSLSNPELPLEENKLKILETKVDYDSDEIIGDSDEEQNSSAAFHVAKKSRISFSTLRPLVSNELNITDNKVSAATNITKEPEAKNGNAIPVQKEVQKTKVQKTPKRKSKKLANNAESLSVRRSTRKNIVKASFEELSSGEEDPFASDNDEQDPEFLPGNQSNTKKKLDVFDFKEIDSELDKTTENTIEKKRGRKKKSPLVKSKTVRKSKQKENPNNEPQSDSTHYELEYNIKPRVVASRFDSLKTVIKQKLAEASKEGSDTIGKDSEEKSLLPKDKRQQAKEKLEQKIASGGLNDNFVTINLRKKVFARGKKGHNFSKFKKAQWKSKKKALYGPDMDMGGCDGGKLICFNCGQEGHFAQKCKATKGDGLLPLTVAEEEECPFPTLEEATKMASESVLSIRIPKLRLQNEEKHFQKEPEENSSTDEWQDDDIEEDLLLAEVMKMEEHVKKLDVQAYIDSVKVVKPYFALKDDGSILDTPREVYEALEKFGHKSFRQGQERAVMRILSGKSTLVTLSTGSGKSLCYQLPAYLYSQREPCMSLIISPLVSLMEDQVTGIPKFLKAACLHTNQTEAHRQKIMDAISTGDLSVLLISPEAVVAGEKRTGFGSLFRKLPPIAFACIDEAHCVSQWSHNFRPSYLMICRVLRESFGVQTILGLTATATRATCESIIQSLDIPDGLAGIISDTPLPDNLHLTVSKDANRDRALINLLLSERFKECKSIIVYCTRREECERIAAFLRTSLKSEVVVESTNKKRKRLNLQAEPYHAGLSASRRKAIQNAFMSGELRVVVATVAFGMGINKSDIRAVIHFNMPNSFESYVQEVGRAGRDGLPAHCHVFLDSQGRDENELRRHIHANSIDRHVIRKLLQKIFIPCACKGLCPKHEVAFSVEQTVRSLDIPEENISTLLCYLELHENKYIELLSPAYTICKVVSYGGPLQIRKAAKDCPPLAMALALHPRKDGEENVLEFPVIDVASAMGWESGICKHKLKNLEWTTVNNLPKRSTLSVQFSNLGFRLLAPGNLADKQLDEALDSLYERVLSQESKALKQLHAVHQTLSEVAEKSYISCMSTSEDAERNIALKEKIRDYFNSADPLANIEIKSCQKINEEQLVNDIRAMVCMYRDNQFTGRTLARIFHGIQSPNYPAVIWGRCKFWRSHLNEDFHEICKVAAREIIRMR